VSLEPSSTYNIFRLGTFNPGNHPAEFSCNPNLNMPEPANQGLKELSGWYVRAELCRKGGPPMSKIERPWFM